MALRISGLSFPTCQTANPSQSARLWHDEMWQAQAWSREWASTAGSEEVEAEAGMSEDDSAQFAESPLGKSKARVYVWRQREGPRN